MRGDAADTSNHGQPGNGRAGAESRVSAPAVLPLPLSCTGFALVVKALRVERDLTVEDLAVLAVLPDDVVRAAEIAGPVRKDLCERILHALHTSAPLTQEQIEIYRDLAGLEELARPIRDPRSPPGGAA